MIVLLRRLIALPGRFARGAWHFIEPPLKVGRIPWARTVLVMQIVAALVFLGYTVAKKGVSTPLAAEPYLVEVMLPDAKGLNPAKEPAAGVAGVNVGKVTAVEFTESGQALVTLRLDPEMRGKVFADATAFVRPTSVLQTLIVNIDPGDPAAGPLPEDEPIDAADTGAFVHIDELTGVLDADTQAQVQVLISEAATALTGREPELRAILSQLGRLTDGATPLAKALAERRDLVSRLTSNLDVMLNTLGQRGRQLAHAIYAGRHTLDVTAAREPELAQATRELAPTLREATGALRATRGLTTQLAPALDDLVPAANSVPPAAATLRKLAPALDDFITLADGVVEDGRKPARLLAGGLRGLSGRVRRDQVPALEELVDLVNLLFEYRYGLVQFAENFSGVVSQNRNAGPYANFAILYAESTAEGFGLPASAAQSRNGEPSRLNRLLAESLEHVCRDSNPLACMARLSLPDLPEEPILASAKSGGGG